MLADTDQEHHLLTGADRAAVHLDVLGHHPGDGRDRALPPQQLFDGRGDDRLVAGDQAPVVGILRRDAEEAVEGVGHRVEPGDDEEEADVEDLLVGEPHPVDLGPHDPAQQVLGGGAPRRFSSVSSK